MRTSDRPTLEGETKLRAVHHIGIPVSDLDRTLAFYRELTGATVLLQNDMRGSQLSDAIGVRNPDLRFAMLQLGNIILEFIEYRTPKGNSYDRANNDVGINHLAFEVENIRELYARLEGKGLAFNAPPHTFTQEDGAPDVVGATFAYFKDPDGIVLEIFEPANRP
jgi:catechol 2,3-dioxygenase-like lactoylglutathione lyase family enzyme